MIERFDHHQKAVNKFTRNDKFFSAVGRFFFEFSPTGSNAKYAVAQRIGLDDSNGLDDSKMTHDFASLCNIAKTAPQQEELTDLELNDLPAWVRDAPDTPARREFGAKYKAKREAKKEKFEALIDKCLDLKDARNAIAHGLIWFEEDGGGKLHHIPRRPLKSDHPPVVDADYITSNADYARSLRVEIDRMLPFAVWWDDDAV